MTENDFCLDFVLGFRWAFRRIDAAHDGADVTALWLLLLVLEIQDGVEQCLVFEQTEPVLEPETRKIVTAAVFKGLCAL